MFKKPPFKRKKKKEKNEKIADITQNTLYLHP